jgi:hypothetical protein
MRIHPVIPLFLVLATSCEVYRTLFPEEEPPPNCELRLPFYPDADGDGVGASSPVFIGCQAPEGWVDQSGDCDDEDPTTIECPDTGETGETGASR